MPDPKGRAPTEADFLFSPLPKKGLGRSPTGSDFIIAPEIEREASENLKQSQLREGFSAFTEKINPISIVEGIGNAISSTYNDPLGAAAEIFAHPVTSVLRARESWKSGDKVAALSQLIGSLDRPGEPSRTQMTQDITSGHPGKALGDILGQGAQVGITMGAGPAVRAIAGKATPTVIRAITRPNPATQEGIEAALEMGIKPSVGQASRGITQTVERLFAGGAKRELEQAQQEVLRENLQLTGSKLRQGIQPLSKEEYGSQAISRLGTTSAGQTLMEENIPGRNFPSKFFEKFYKTPEQTRKLAGALGPRGRNLLKGDYFDNQITPKLFDEAGNFNSNWLVGELNNSNSVIKDIYSASERSGMMKFAQAAKAVSPDLQQAGRASLGIRTGIAVIGLTRAIAGRGSILGSFPGAELSIEVGMNQFAKNVLLNPRNAAIAARLLKIPPDSAESVFGQRVLLKALGAAGVTGMVRLADGTSKPVQITEGGKFKDLE